MYTKYYDIFFLTRRADQQDTAWQQALQRLEQITQTQADQQVLITNILDPSPRTPLHP